ncbi:MAG: TatD family hydrolase, partial [Desulfobulbus sp.]|nr:TatD family hydrolase [Desulfobulbus sp.]
MQPVTLSAPLPALSAQSEFVDTHCHLDMDDYSTDLDNVIQAAARHDVKRILTIGINLSSSGAAVSLAERHINIFAAVGIHPHEAHTAS